MIKAARLFNWQGHLGLGYFDPEFLFQDQNDPTRKSPLRAFAVQVSPQMCKCKERPGRRMPWQTRKFVFLCVLASLRETFRLPAVSALFTMQDVTPGPVHKIISLYRPYTHPHSINPDFIR